MDSPARQRSILLIASLVSSLVMLDSNVVAVALPTIATSLGADFADMQWVITAYVLPFAALLLAAGSFGDKVGRRKAALLGQLIFAAASLVRHRHHAAAAQPLARPSGRRGEPAADGRPGDHQSQLPGRRAGEGVRLLGSLPGDRDHLRADRRRPDLQPLRLALGLPDDLPICAALIAGTVRVIPSRATPKPSASTTRASRLSAAGCSC